MNSRYQIECRVINTGPSGGQRILTSKYLLSDTGDNDKVLYAGSITIPVSVDDTRTNEEILHRAILEKILGRSIESAIQDELLDKETSHKKKGVSE